MEVLNAYTNLECAFPKWLCSKITQRNVNKIDAWTLHLEGLLH